MSNSRLQASAASDTATRPVFEKLIPTSVGVRRGLPPLNLPLTKMEKVAKFQPDMVKIGFRGQNAACKFAAFRLASGALGTKT